jgi:outer membrane lipoprotein-sorting protein
MYKKILGLVLLSLFVISCGSRKGIKGIATKNAEAANIIEKHYQNEVDFTTLSGKLRTVYQSEERTQSVNLSFRMEKDKAIWMSASVLGFPVAKAYITPSRVSYYEKVSQTYFDGDFRLLSDLLGTPLDFKKLQNLLIGQAIYDLREEEFEFSQTAKGFQFMPSEDGLIKKMFLVNSKNFKASAQQLAQTRENKSVTVTYSDYQEIEGKIFPEEIRIIANEAGSSTRIELTYRSLEFNQGELSFPFDIPSGYDEISL